MFTDPIGAQGEMKSWDADKKKRRAEAIPVRRLGTGQGMSFLRGEAVNSDGGAYLD